MIEKTDPKYFFTADETDQLIQAIQAIEAKTTGRIYIYLERRCLITDPLSRAIKLFHRLHLGRDKHRNSVLIYFATEYRLFSILGDEGLNGEVPRDFWHNIRVHMEEAFGTGNWLGGTLAAIQKVGPVLAQKFPRAETKASVN